MKKTLSILLTIIQLLSLSACSDSLEAAEVIEVNTAQDSPTYVEGEDYQLRWNHWNSIEARKFTMSENGYYYYSSYGDLLLHFYDFATETDVIVCNQPNCDHTDPECNARLSSLGTHIESIQYYDGNLYVIGVGGGIAQDVEVFRISANGSTRGKVGTILTMSEGQTVSSVIHRGYAYCALSMDGSLSLNSINIYRLSLSGGADPEVIYAFDEAYGAGAELKAYGNDLYICHAYYTDKAGNNFMGDLYRYNILTDKMEKALDGNVTNFAVDETYVYYSNTTEVLAYNLESGETTVLGNQGLVHPVIDGNYLYLDNSFHILNLLVLDDINNYDNRGITMIDRNTFEIVTTIPLTVPYSFFVGSCGNHLFAYYDYTLYHCDLNAVLAGEESAWVEMN